MRQGVVYTVNSVYGNPKYYEIAFSYRDIPAEVNVFEESIYRYSQIPVQTVLELACGHSPHMIEWCRRGYRYFGIDINQEMLDYSQRRAAEHHYKTTVLNASLVDFTLKEPVDFCFTMLGSLYVKNTEELRSHFDAVSKALNPGGLYFLDWCVDFTPLADAHDSWTLEEDNIKVTAYYHADPLNAVKQTFTETMELSVIDNGTPVKLREQAIRRAIFPQEFLLLIDNDPNFEFLGWWNNWNLHAPLDGTEKTISRPIIIVRRLTPPLDRDR